MRPRMFYGGAICALVLAAAGVTGAAQQARSLFFDTVDVRVVNVEVVVTDRQGRPVNGLARDDFEVLEDGRPVELSYFFAVEDRRVVETGDPGAGPEVAELAIEPDTRRLNLVVYVDNANMRPESRNRVFDELEAYIADRLDPRDRVMIVAAGERVEVAQPFTNDSAALLSTLERLESEVGPFAREEVAQRRLLRELQAATLSAQLTGPGVPSARNFEGAQMNADRLARDIERLAEVRFRRVRATVEALGTFCSSLAGMKGRKAILYVSDGLPLRSADSLSRAWLNKFENWIQSENAGDARRALLDMTALSNGTRFDASGEFRDLVRDASAHRVVFYPLASGRGIIGSNVSAEFQAAGTSSGRGAVSADVVALEAQSVEASLLQMAEGTGGVAFTRSTNIDGLLDRVALDFGTFYSLGYSPEGEEDQRLHEIEVKTRRQGLVVRHVSAHRERDPLEQLRDLTLSALHYDMVENPLEVRLDPEQAVHVKGKRYQVMVMVKIPFRNLLLLPQAEHHVGQVSLVVVAGSAAGAASPPRRVDLPIEVPNAQMLEIAQQVVAYPMQLELREGPQRIAVGIRDHLGRVDSTVTVELAPGRAAEADAAVGS